MTLYMGGRQIFETSQEVHKREEDNKSNKQVISFQAIAPLTGQKKGVNFLREHISFKKGTCCPLISHDISSFKDTCLLIK
jgi:hypothetical protein